MKAVIVPSDDRTTLLNAAAAYRRAKIATDDAGLALRILTATVAARLLPGLAADFSDDFLIVVEHKSE